MITIAILRAAGASEAFIARVAELEEKERLATQREQNRKRQQKHRARNECHSDARDERDASINKKERKKEGSLERARSARRPQTHLPNDFHPELVGQIEFDRFCDYWRAKGTTHADWDAAWRNWQRNAPRFNGNGGQNVQGRRHGSVLDAADRLRAKLNEQGSFGEQYIPGTSGPEPLRLDKGPRPVSLKLIPKG